MAVALRARTDAFDDDRAPEGQLHADHCFAGRHTLELGDAALRRFVRGLAARPDAAGVEVHDQQQREVVQQCRNQGGTDNWGQVTRIFASDAADGDNFGESVSFSIDTDDASWSADWETWLQETCPEQAVDTRGPSFSLYSLMLEEACNGAGVMMGHAALVSGHIESGSLVAPWPGVVQLERRLAIATPTTRGRVSTASQVIDELLKQ